MADINILLLSSFTLWGAAVGTIVGFTAVGTGLLGVSGLMLIFGFDPLISVGTMGVTGFFLMFSGAIQHKKNNNIHMPVALMTAATAVPMSYITATYAEKINDIIPLRYILGGIIILSAGLLFYRYFIMKNDEAPFQFSTWKKFSAPIMGIILGGLMGVTSISGSILVVMFLLVMHMPAVMAVGTTSAVSAVSLLVAGIAHVHGGNVDWPAILGLVPGALIGAAIGAKFSDYVPVKILRIGILLILLAAGVMIFV
ncbi:MAG: sulfite exporter TauE/SafE family protein [Spirochaetales bacterium]|nr:sulfite exporter TauE/SafE family protein [Spirochaetales bacterium]